MTKSSTNVSSSPSNPLSWFKSLHQIFSKSVAISFRDAMPMMKATRMDKWDYLENIVNHWSNAIAQNDFNKENRRTRNKSPSLPSSVAFGIYISGTPGTGKSALVQSFFDSFISSEKAARNITYIYVNCIQVNPVKKVLQTIWMNLIEKRKSSNPNMDNILSDISNVYTPVILVLDEMDTLISADFEYISKLYSLSCRSFNPWMVVGIANSMNLLEEESLKKQLAFHQISIDAIHFKSFTETAFRTALLGRAQLFGVSLEEDIKAGKIEKGLLEICIKKMGNANGDIRKVLDLMKLVVENAEADYVGSGSQDQTTQRASDPLIRLRHVQAAFSALNKKSDGPGELPVTHQLIMLAFLRLSGNRITFDNLYETYSHIAASLGQTKKIDFSNFTRNELKDTLTLMETMGMISCTPFQKISQYKLLLDPTPQISSILM